MADPDLVHRARRSGAAELLCLTLKNNFPDYAYLTKCQMESKNLLCIFYKTSFMFVEYVHREEQHRDHDGRIILNFLRVPGNIQGLKDGLEFITVIDRDILERIERAC